MARFLSEAWFADINARQIEVDPQLALTVDHRVGDTCWRVSLSGGHLTVAPAAPAAPGPAEATLTLDAATAAELAAGTLDASRALLGGRIKVSGDLSALAAALPHLNALRQALTEVRDATDF